MKVVKVVSAKRRGKGWWVGRPGGCVLRLRRGRAI
jgi:hypothetical protein